MTDLRALNGFPIAPERPCSDCGRPTSYRVNAQDADYQLYTVARCAPGQGCADDYAAWLKATGKRALT